MFQVQTLLQVSNLGREGNKLGFDRLEAISSTYCKMIRLFRERGIPLS
jgi:hypothetical protein